VQGDLCLFQLNSVAAFYACGIFCAMNIAVPIGIWFVVTALPLTVYWLTFVFFKTWWKRWICWGVLILFVSLASGKTPYRQGEMMGTMLLCLLFVNGCRWIVKGVLLLISGSDSGTEKYVEEAKRMELEIERRRDLR
jgi:hypothetical protein